MSRSFPVSILSLIPAITLLAILSFHATGCSRESAVGAAGTFNPSDTLCARFGCAGTFVDGIEWTDSRGENVFFLTEDQVPSDDGSLQRLRAYRFVILEGGVPRQTWQRVDEAENWCDEGEGLIGDIELTDLNDDGVGEISYVFNVAGSCDVSPKEYELVMHTGVGPGAHEITGTDDLAVYGDIPEKGKMELSESLASASDTIQSYARQLWKNRVPHE